VIYYIHNIICYLLCCLKYTVFFTRLFTIVYCFYDTRIILHIYYCLLLFLILIFQTCDRNGELSGQRDVVCGAVDANRTRWHAAEGIYAPPSNQEDAEDE
jgi:hypothetical protein